VLADYGHGAVMAVPAHDQRDLDFARKFDLPVRVVVDTLAPVTGAIPIITEEMLNEPVPVIDPAVTGEALAGEGRMINSGPLDGLSKNNAIKRVIEILEAAGTGRAARTFRLRDWLISRQRFWGTPIPIIHGGDGELIPVPEDQLPVVLPPTDGLDLQPRGESPLSAATDWVTVPDPRDGSPARRDADTMDTFVDSSWYFLRFLSPNGRLEGLRPRRGREVGSRRPVRGRRRARDPAPALRAIHHEGALRPRLRELHGAVQRAAQPGHGAERGQEDVQAQPQGHDVHRRGSTATARTPCA
jgi:leucyl-tRNA synthetase